MQSSLINIPIRSQTPSLSLLMNFGLSFALRQGHELGLARSETVMAERNRTQWEGVLDAKASRSGRFGLRRLDWGPASGHSDGHFLQLHASYSI